MGTNLNNATANIRVSEVVSAAKLSLADLGSPRVVLNGGSSIDDVQIGFDNLGSGAWIFGDTCSMTSAVGNLEEIILVSNL